MDYFTTCKGTLASLTESYTTNSDGTYTPGDPAALKVLAVQDTIDDLLTEFADAIPTNDEGAVLGTFNHFYDIVDRRNAVAIVDYNTTLQLLLQVPDKNGNQRLTVSLTQASCAT
jgi:hypothetical protein